MHEKLFSVKKDRNFFNSTDALYAFGLGFMFMQLGGIIALALSDVDTVWVFFIQASGLAFFLAYAYLKRINIETALSVNKMKLANVPVLVLASVFLLMISILLSDIVSIGLDKIGYVYSEATVYPSAVSEIAAISIVSILPMLCEEFLFRGMVFHGLLSKGKGFAMIISALLFTLMHANPAQTLHPFIIGLVMAYTVYVTGSIFASMIIHFTNNLTVMLLELYFYDLVTVMYPVFFIAPLGLAAVFLLLKAVNGSPRFTYGTEQSKSVQLQENMRQYLLSSPLPPDDIAARHRSSYFHALNAERSDRHRALAWFWVSFALCVLNWLLMLFSGFLPQLPQ